LTFKWFCPAIVNPTKYKFVPEDLILTRHTYTTLIYCSKILNEFSLNSIKPERDEQVQKFIQANYEELEKILRQFAVS
jgi:hypothetical protein